MIIEKISTVSFSPTGTSRRVVKAIASGIPEIPVENVDITYPDAVTTMQFGSKDLVVIGVPVYAGRVAALAIERLHGIVGHNTPAIIVVTYGNRAFEDALIELYDISVSASFKPIAACAFIGEHSFSSREMPIAAGRPDEKDVARAMAYGAEIRKKLNSIDSIENCNLLEVPGHRPYKDGMGQLPFSPMLLDMCTQCGVCLAACPTGAISLKSKIAIDCNLCIFCCSCIKSCPEGALEIAAAPLEQKRQWLYDHCKERQEAQLYL